jgi:hypothetical protein
LIKVITTIGIEMQNGISIKILYFAEQKAVNQLYDLDGVEEFREDLSENYVSVVQGKPGDLGGLEKFMIDIIASITLESFVKFILAGVAFDLIKSGTKSFVIRPFLNAYKKLKDRNRENLDIERLSVTFEDTEVHLYKIYDDSIINSLENVLKHLALHYSSLYTVDGEKPSEIHVPVFRDESQSALAPYRVKLNVEETIQTFCAEDYWKYWGICYEYTNRQVVYDVMTRRFVQERFLTLQQYWNEWHFRNRGILRIPL